MLSVTVEVTLHKIACVQVSTCTQAILCNVTSTVV